MIDYNLYLAFVMAAFLVIATPGPSALFVVARSINLGIRGGFLSVIGVSIGALCHAIAVSLGLAQVLSSSPEAFIVIKNLGCIYLIFLGIKTFLSKEPRKDGDMEKDNNSKNVIKQGMLVELLNPKTALFFLAFLPQFTNGNLGNVGVQLVVLGLTFVAIGLLCDGMYTLLAGQIGSFLKKSTWFRRIEKYVSGSVYCSLGVIGLFCGVEKQ